MRRHFLCFLFHIKNVKKYVLKGERKMSSIPSTAGLIPGTVVFYKSKGLAEKATVLEPKKKLPFSSYVVENLFALHRKK